MKEEGRGTERETFYDKIKKGKKERRQQMKRRPKKSEDEQQTRKETGDTETTKTRDEDEEEKEKRKRKEYCSFPFRPIINYVTTTASRRRSGEKGGEIDLVGVEEGTEGRARQPSVSVNIITIPPTPPPQGDRERGREGRRG